MRRQRKKKDDSWLMGLILLVGAPLYLIMEHALVFLLVFVPLTIILVFLVVQWFKKDKLSDFVAAFIVAFIMLIAFIVRINNPKSGRTVVGPMPPKETKIGGDTFDETTIFVGRYGGFGNTTRRTSTFNTFGHRQGILEVPIRHTHILIDIQNQP